MGDTYTTIKTLWPHSASHNLPHQCKQLTCPADRTKKLGEIEHMCHNESIDIFYVSETWLTNIPESIPVRRRADLESKHLERVLREINYQNNTVFAADHSG